MKTKILNDYILQIVSLVTLLCSFSAFSLTENRVGYFYPVGQMNSPFLFKQETKVEIIDAQNRNTFSKISDPDGKVVMTEISKIQNGITTMQVMDQLQINERYTLTVENQKAIFKTYDIKDINHPTLTDENEVKIEKTFYTGPSLELGLLNLLPKLKEEKKCEIRFGIFELQKMINFELIKGKKISHEENLIPLKMQLSSLLSLFVDPLYLEIDPNTGLMKYYRGRTPVRVMKNGKWVPLDADIVYLVGH